MKPSIRNSILGLTLMTVANATCTTTAYDSAYYDPYSYYTYYPADVYYSSYYWADPYYYYYQDGYGGSDGGSTATGGGGGASAADASASGGSGGSSSTGRQSFGDVIRALARGETVCAGQVTVTPRMVANPCPTAGAETVRGGATVVFNGCMLPAGGTLNGSIDVETTRTASDTTCGTSTSITVAHTTTIANLSYTGPGGRRIVIPNQTGTGMSSFLNGERPTAASTSINGRMQIFNAGNDLISDRSYEGDLTVTPASDKTSYAIDGTLVLEDEKGAGSTTVTANGLTRTGECCHPTGGRVTLERMGDMPFKEHVFSFDSTSCGEALFDDKRVSLSACP